MFNFFNMQSKEERRKEINDLILKTFSLSVAKILFKEHFKDNIEEGKDTLKGILDSIRECMYAVYIDPHLDVPESMEKGLSEYMEKSLNEEKELIEQQLSKLGEIL